MEDNSFVWDEDDFVEEVEDIQSQEDDDDEILDYDMFNKVPEHDDEDDEFVYKRQINFKPYLLIAIIIVVIIGYQTMNVFTLTEFDTNELIFIEQSSLLKISGLEEGKSYSRNDLHKASKALKDSQIGEVNTSYDLKDGLFYVDIEEIKPLAMQDGTLYYSDGGEILSTKEESYVVPVLFDFDEDSTNDILKALNGLEYSIIKEIAAIKELQEFDGNSLVLLQMNDGNYVQIYINQITQKMQYYLQMHSIIDEKNGGKPGLIHLDIGDYYEPIS